MALLNNALLQIRSPFLVAKRFRGKINIQRPRKPHFERQLLIDFAKPIYGPSKFKLPEITLCDAGVNKKKKEIDNPFERILATECLNWFNTSKMVVFLHMNSISMDDKTPIFSTLKKNDMHLRTYGKKIVSMATKGTRYEAVNNLFTSHQNIIFGQSDQADKMFKILKKAPQMVVMDSYWKSSCQLKVFAHYTAPYHDHAKNVSGKTKNLCIEKYETNPTKPFRHRPCTCHTFNTKIFFASHFSSMAIVWHGVVGRDLNTRTIAGGIVHDQLLSRNELIEFSKQPNIDMARSQLCAVLESAGSCIVGQLNQSQQTLVSHLQKHVELQSSEQKSETEQ